MHGVFFLWWWRPILVGSSVPLLLHFFTTATVGISLTSFHLNSTQLGKADEPQSASLLLPPLSPPSSPSPLSRSLVPNCDYLAGPPAVVSRSSSSSSSSSSHTTTTSTLFQQLFSSADLLYFLLLVLLVHCFLVYGNPLLSRLYRRGSFSGSYSSSSSPAAATTSTTNTRLTPTADNSHSHSSSSTVDQIRGSSPSAAEAVASAEGEQQQQLPGSAVSSASSASTTSTVSTVATVDRLSPAAAAAVNGDKVEDAEETSNNTTANKLPRTSNLDSLPTTPPSSFPLYHHHHHNPATTVLLASDNSLISTNTSDYSVGRSRLCCAQEASDYHHHHHSCSPSGAAFASVSVPQVSSFYSFSPVFKLSAVQQQQQRQHPLPFTPQVYYRLDASTLDNSHQQQHLPPSTNIIPNHTISTKMVDIHMNNNGGQPMMYGGQQQQGSPADGYMEQEEEWEREGLLDPAWEKQQRKVRCHFMFFSFPIFPFPIISVRSSDICDCRHFCSPSFFLILRK